MPILSFSYIVLLTIMLAISSEYVNADNSKQDNKISPAPITVEIQDKIRTLLGGNEISSIAHSPIKGFYEALINEGGSMIVSEDLRYMVVGDVYEISATGQGIVNHSEQKRFLWRKNLLSTVSLRDMLIFSPSQKPKTHVSVFTDVDCGYCRKLHQEVAQLNRNGIEVRYLAFPRSGIGSETYKRMVTAWCAGDGKRKLTALKNGEHVPIKLCTDNPVSKQYELGQRLGVRGTPAIITANGELLPGYMPANELTTRLGIN